MNGIRHRRLPPRLFAALVLLGAPLLLFVTALLQVLARPDRVNVAFNWDQGIPAAVTSLAAAALTSLLVVALSLGFASLALRASYAVHASSTRMLCIGLGIALVPFFLGSTSFAFLWSGPLQPLLASPIITERGYGSVIVIDVLAQVLRYAPLLTWLLVVVGLEVDATRVLYLRGSGFRTRDFIRDEAARKWSLLCLVVAAFAFQEAANDYIVTYLALRPSPATETELISHFLQRQFTTSAISGSAQDALGTVLVGSGLFAIIGMVVFAILAIPLFGLRRLSASYHRGLGSRQKATERVRPRISTAVVIVALASVSLTLCIRLVQMDFAGWELVRTLGWTALLALFAAAASWLIAGVLVYAVRDAATLGDGTAQRRLALMALVAVAIGFIPTIGLAVAVQSLVFSGLGTGVVAAHVGWFLAQSLRLIPVLAIFMIPSLLGVEDDRLDYLRQVGVGFRNRSTILFFRPLQTTHLALLLIAWNWILNESTISAIFQADIPSFGQLLLLATSGRSAAYPVAASLAGAAALLFTSISLMWAWRVYSGWRHRNAISSTR